MSLPPTAYVILGMLRLGAETGYDIKRAVEVSTRFFWTISEAQIYPMLARLDKDGLIVGHDASHGRRKRRAYELTPKGEKALIEWLSFEEPLPFEVRDVALLKLFFADAAEPEAAIEVIRRLRSRSEQELGVLRAQEAPSAELAESGGGRFPAIALRAGIAVHESLIAVAAELEAELAAESG